MKMKSTVFPLANDSSFTSKINAALAGILGKEKILTNLPPIMGSEDFRHLVRHNVNGTVVLRNGKTVANIFPGQAVLGKYKK